MIPLEARMNVSRMLGMFMRLAMAVQLILGIGFWTGHWVGLVNLHMAIGALFVLAFWVIAGIAIAQKKPAGLAVFAFLWGVVVFGVGMAQRGILVGDLHWIIRVVHLVIGIAAMPIAEKLVAAPPGAVARTA